MTLDTPPSEELIKEVLLKIFKDKNFIFKIEPGSNIGDGFLGITALVTVNFKDEEQVKYLFMKMATKNKLLREAMFQKELFTREAYFYSKVYQIIQDLHFKTFKREFILPKCYYTSDEDLKECVVLENLTKKNYKLIKSKGFDRNHLLAVLKTYSELHACGFIMKSKNTEVMKEFSRKFDRDYFRKHFERFGLQKLLLKSLNILKESLKETDKLLLNKFEDIKSRLLLADKDLYNEQEYSTIIQQDCWKNNIMFKYNDQNEIQDVKLIDLQMWCVNSPIFDVAHLFYTNVTSKEILDDSDYYLNFYYNSLCDTIVKMNGNPESLYPKDVFIQQWKKFSFYGLWMAVIVVRGLLAPVESLPNLIQYVKENKSLEDAFMFDLPDENEYCERIKLLLYHFIKNKLI